MVSQRVWSLWFRQVVMVPVGHKEVAARAGVASTPKPWWVVVDSGTEEGVGRMVELGDALQAFAATVEVDGAGGYGQLASELGAMDGQKD